MRIRGSELVWDVLNVMMWISAWMPRRTPVSVAAALVLTALSSVVRADADFENWLKQLGIDAQKQGISQSTLDGALAGLQLDLSLPDLVIPGRPLKEQAEFIKLPADYLPEQQLAGLAKAGRRYLSTYNSLLQKVEAQYGVPGNIVIAIWARETDYGAERQRHNVIRSLATEAYLGRRKDIFRNELLIALKLVENGTIKMDAMGSWSGAMGQTQFEPSDFEKFAVDGDNDGKIDLSNSIPDALASAAKQLRDYGWKRSKQWGFEVRLPQGISCLESSPDIKRSLADWLDLGLVPAFGTGISRDMLDDTASLVLPAGSYGPGFLAMENFQVLRRYNASDLYALFVGHLADLIAGGPAFEKAWTKLPAFSGRETGEIQRHLSGKKYYFDAIDGRLGSVTRHAIGEYQKATNLRIDCWPSTILLDQMRRSKQGGSGERPDPGAGRDNRKE
jgi:lytic murein transglycosylase